MKGLSLPIYRAKRIDSDDYVEGYYCNVCRTDLIVTDDTIKTFDADENRVLYGTCETGIVQIDLTTLSISFPDILDSEGNKIFASLSEDGKGGDIIEVIDCECNKYVYIYNKYLKRFGISAIKFSDGDWEWADEDEVEADSCKVIGIKQ